MASIALVSVAILGCNPLSKMAKEAENIQYNVNPSPLEMVGDSVAVNISAKYPPKFFPKKVTLEVTPVLKEVGENGAVIKELTPITLIGQDADGEGTKISFDQGGSANYADKVAYAKNMENVELELRAEAKFKTKTKDIGNRVIGNGTIITAKLVMNDEKPILGADKFTKTQVRTFNGTINYLINSADVRSSELKKQEMQDLEAFLKTASEKNYVFKSITIEAYASPDGEIRRNENLADNRAKTANTALSNMMRKAKIKIDSKELIKLEGKGEDWAGFEAAMKKSSIKDKDLILRVLGMYNDNEQREKEIKNMAATYLEIADQILPGLRRAKISIVAEEQSRSDEEIIALMTEDPSQLSVEEMLYSATLTSDLNTKLAYYQTAEKTYPADWRTSNNVGYIYMLQSKTKEAKESFEKAANAAPSQAIVNNNMGVIARLNGDVNAASEYYKNAKGAGSEVNYNMGIVQIIKGDYSAAQSSFGSEKSFNAALAQLLNGNTDGALKTIEASPEKDIAESYYLKAIIGARNSNKELMTKNLQSAMKMNAKFRTKAQNDAEFIKFREDSDFKGLF